MSIVKPVRVNSHFFSHFPSTTLREKEYRQFRGLTVKHRIMVFRVKIPDVWWCCWLPVVRTGRKHRNFPQQLRLCIFVNFDYKEMRTSKRVMHFRESFVLNLDLENKYFRSRLYKMHSIKSWSIFIRENHSIKTINIKSLVSVLPRCSVLLKLLI